MERLAVRTKKLGAVIMLLIPSQLFPPSFASLFPFLVNIYTCMLLLLSLRKYKVYMMKGLHSRSMTARLFIK